MKIKKNIHEHKKTENSLHKKSKSMNQDIEPEITKRSPGAYFGRKWFPFTPSTKK